jgi:hypothetical protein
LLSVAHCGIGKQELLLLPDPFDHGFGAAFIEELLCSPEVFRNGHLRNRRNIEFHLMALGLVYNNISKVIQNTVLLVGSRYNVEKLRIFGNKARVAFALQEGFVVEYID